jgi:hypothetical protein
MQKKVLEYKYSPISPRVRSDPWPLEGSNVSKSQGNDNKMDKENAFYFRNMIFTYACQQLQKNLRVEVT